MGSRKEADPEAEFVLLVPATRVEHLRKAMAQDTRTNAETMATRAVYALYDGGIRLLRTTVGDDSPIVAIQDELAGHPGFYKEVIVSTLPANVSRWLTLGIQEKIEATFQVPVSQHYGWDDSMAWMETIE